MGERQFVDGARMGASCIALYSVSASCVPIRAGLAPRPPLSASTLGLPPTGGGLIVAGSYVPKTTQQIEALLAQTEVLPVVVQVAVTTGAVRAVQRVSVMCVFRKPWIPVPTKWQPHVLSVT